MEPAQPDGADFERECTVCLAHVLSMDAALAFVVIYWI